MEIILDKMPKEDKIEVNKLLEEGKKIKHRIRKCLSCKKEINILETYKKRTITCPHCEMQMQTRL